MKTTDSVMREKIEGNIAYKNPSYDKLLPPRDRLADFLGKYHVVLNGVVKHDPFVKSEDDGGGMCCQDHKVEILDFVDNLFSDSLAEARRELIDEIHSFVTAGELENYTSDGLAKYLYKKLDLLTGDNPENECKVCHRTSDVVDMSKCPFCEHDQELIREGRAMSDRDTRRGE